MENVDPFTGAELRAMLAAAQVRDPDLATILRLWVQSGMRAGEVCGLQWQDLDLSAGTALVRRTWSRQRLAPTKTGPERTVSILHPVADQTSDWQPGATEGARTVVASIRQLTVRSLDDPGAFVFGRGRVPLSSRELHRRWRRALIAAKVRYRAPEQLRHTFASTMLSRNAPCCAKGGRLAVGLGPAACVRAVDARRIRGRHPEPTIRNPAATSARRRGLARAPERALTT